MDVLTLIIKILLSLFSIFLIIVILMQPGNKAGLPGSIAGGAEIILGRSKARGMKAILSKLTKIVAVGFMLLAVVLVLLYRFAM